MTVVLDQNCLKEVPKGVFHKFNSLMGVHIQYNKIDDLTQVCKHRCMPFANVWPRCTSPTHRNS